MGAYKRYREFGGKEQREEPRVREFREFGTASLRGITVVRVWIIWRQIIQKLKAVDWRKKSKIL